MAERDRWVNQVRWTVAVGALLVAGCDAHVNRFIVEPRHICAGESVQVQWIVQGSGNITVTPPTDGLVNGPINDEGRAVITPTATSTMVKLQVTRWLGHPDGAEQEIVVTPAHRETLAANLADPSTAPSCGDGRVRATVHAKRFSPNVKVSTVAAHAGDRRIYEVQHSGRSATVKPGEMVTDFRDTPLAGDWTLSAPVGPGESCGSIAQVLVIDVNTQCEVGGGP